MSVFFDFDDVDAFTTGAVGEPGQRTFFMQVRRMGERVTIKCEKQHSSALADTILQIVSGQPSPADRPLPMAMELGDVSDVAFTLGGISLGFDPDTRRVIIQFEEAIPVNEDGELDEDFNGGKVRASITVGQAMAFVDIAQSVVSAGRPNCLFCGQPIDPLGHLCPRMN